MSFMLRARQTGATRHRPVGKDRLVDRWIHAIMTAERAVAEEYARWLLEQNSGPDGSDSVQVIDACRRGRRPVAVLTASDIAPFATAGASVDCGEWPC
jgi:hypothetical protein